MKSTKLITRWSLLTGVLTAIFWLLYFLIEGDVPVVSGWQIDTGIAWEYPFEIFRQWDVLWGPICTMLIVWLFAKATNVIRREKVVAAVLGLLMGTAAGVSMALATPEQGFMNICVIYMCLSASLLLGLFTATDDGLAAGYPLGIAVGLFEGLMIGLVMGLPVGLAFILANSLLVSIIFGLAAIFRPLTRISFWKRMADWMMAR